MAREAGPLEKVLSLDALLELVHGQEEVVAAFHLARPSGTSGGRDGQHEIGKQRQHVPDEGALTRAGGTGDDDESGDDRS